MPQHPREGRQQHHGAEQPEREIDRDGGGPARSLADALVGVVGAGDLRPQPRASRQGSRTALAPFRLGAVWPAATWPMTPGSAADVAEAGIVAPPYRRSLISYIIYQIRKIVKIG
jgi:hypothetical protein